MSDQNISTPGLALVCQNHTTSLENLRISVSILDVNTKKIQSDITTLCSKLDNTITQLNLLNNNMIKVVSTHDEQLKNVRDKVSETVNKVDKLENGVLLEIKEMRLEFNNLFESIASRLEKLERWKWYIMGGFALASVLVGVFAANAPEIFKIIYTILKSTS